MSFDWLDKGVLFNAEQIGNTCHPSQLLQSPARAVTEGAVAQEMGPLSPSLYTWANRA